LTHHRARSAPRGTAAAARGPSPGHGHCFHLLTQNLHEPYI
jgi:hypothetical protein